MNSPIVRVDDNHITRYRKVWISDVPHFCGEDDCMHEGDYEIRLDVDDSIWTNGDQRDVVIESLTRWCSDPRPGNEGEGPEWDEP
jgi:hypothetical protein